MKKEYLIFDMDWTLVHSMWDSMQIIYDYIEKIDPELLDKSRYIFENTFGWPLIKQLEEVFWEWYDIQKITNDIYKMQFYVKTEFFLWVPEKIKELAQKYTLFLTTWNSTKVAIKHLEKWWIKENFSMILWSDILLKGREHIEEFIKYTSDTDFSKKAVYTWDWEWDKFFASEYNIDFIRIGKFWKDKYEINSVVEIDEILEEL